MASDSNHGAASSAERKRQTEKIQQMGEILLVIVLLIFTAISLRRYLKPDDWGEVPTLGQDEPLCGDMTPPKILGIHDFSVFEGEDVPYRQGVSVTDDSGENIVLEVDSSAVRLDTPGIYIVRYSAADSAGNKATDLATVTVVDRNYAKH